MSQIAVHGSAERLVWACWAVWAGLTRCPGWARWAGWVAWLALARISGLAALGGLHKDLLAGPAALATNFARWVRWIHIITAQYFLEQPDWFDWLG